MMVLSLLLGRGPARCREEDPGRCDARALVDTLRRDGFVVIRSALPRSVCDAVRGQLEGELDPAGGENRRVTVPLGADHSAMGALACLVAANASFFLAAFSGEGTLRTLQTIVGLPGASAQHIHSDIDGDRDVFYCNGFVALQDVAAVNGPTAFFAGTHTTEFHAARQEFTKCRATMGEATRVDSPDDPLASAPRRALLLGAGDLVVFDAKVHHQGTANTSPQRRYLLQFSFLSGASDPRQLPGNIRFMASPDVRAGQYLVRDLVRGR